MDPRTTTDIIIMLVIFLALVISLSVLAWRHPVSLGSLRAVPNYGTALPAPNTARPVHSIASHGHSFAYPLHPLDMLLLIHRWFAWAPTPHNRINRISSITDSYREDPVAGARRVALSYTPTLTPTTAFTFSEGASTINTPIDNEAVELHDLDKIKASTSSLAETNHMEHSELIVHVHGDPPYEAGETSVCSTVEVDITDIDKVAMGRQPLQ